MKTITLDEIEAVRLSNLLNRVADLLGDNVEIVGDVEGYIELIKERLA